MSEEIPVIDGQTDLLDLVPLPTVEGCVHGIVGLDPARIQCDGCLYVYTAEPGMKNSLAIILSGIRFNPRRYDNGDRRRLCQECRRKEWDE